MSGYLFPTSNRKCTSFKIHRQCPFVLLINPLNAKFNPICHLLALLGAHHIFHVSRIRVKLVWRQGAALGGENVRLMGS
jgi:hypothetical protein